jgi:PAS domain S-box-containing protein
MNNPKLDALRIRAEELLAFETEPLTENSDNALRAALHELKTHQIELELQNEELRRVQEELLETRDKFVDLYDFSPVGYLTVSADGLILEANLTVAEMFGVQRSRLIQQPLSAFIFRQDQDILYRCRKSLLQSKKAPICQLRIKRDDGSLFFASLKSIVTPEVEGNSGRFRAIITDISELKHAEEKLKASSEAIKLFAYSIAHDLKNPAFAIHLLARVLHDKHGGSLNEQGRNLCSQIFQSSREVSEMIDKITTFIETKENESIIEKVVFDEVLRTIREEFENQFTLRTITFVEPGNKPEIILADRFELLRVLRNFVDNALKYGGEKLKFIECTYNNRDNFHVLCISDDGRGMEEATAEKMFGLFKRNPATPEIKGAGLGLAIVREIAEKNGGRAWSEPRPEKGITFCISIPVIN